MSLPKTKLTIGSCFSGIGGLELGLEWTNGFETKWQIENDGYAKKVLEKHWPKVKRYGDIKTIKETELERVDLFCAGYPCQPFSQARQVGGKWQEHKSNIWHEAYRLICFLKPRFIFLENVPAHINRGFDRVLGDLAQAGYDAEWLTLQANQFGGSHYRERLFVIAYPESNRFLSTQIFPGNIYKELQAFCKQGKDFSPNLTEVTAAEFGWYPHPCFLEAMMGFPIHWTDLNV